MYNIFILLEFGILTLRLTSIPAIMFPVTIPSWSRFDSKNPYSTLDMFEKQIQEQEAVMAALTESANIFEVITPGYRQLRQCR